MKKFLLTFVVVLLFCLGSTTTAQETITVSSKPGSDINFLPQEGKTRIGSYVPLAQLPGIPAVIDPGLESGEAGSFTLPQYIRTIVRISIGVIGVLAVVMIVVAGVQYMGSDMITEKESARSRLMGAVFGLILALSSVLLLRTINPQLTSLSIGDERFQEGVEGKGEVIGLPSKLIVEYLDTLPNTTISSSDTDDEAFKGYLAHQQGAGGASAILWAAKNQHKTVPANNPYVKGESINANMKNNWNAKSAQKNIGTSELTPENFIKYWATQVKKIKTAQTPKIEPSINEVLTKVAQEDGMDLLTLQTFCRIESYKQCSSKESITHTNSDGFTGLFQFGLPAWKDYGKGGSRTNAYDNTKAAVRLHKANMATLKKNGF